MSSKIKTGIIFLGKLVGIYLSLPIVTLLIRFLLQVGKYCGILSEICIFSLKNSKIVEKWG